MSTSSRLLDLNELKAQILENLKTGKPLLGSGGALTPLIKEVVEASLEGELEAHLAEEDSENNRRNGKLKKTVKSASGTFELETPRDRNGSFESA